MDGYGKTIGITVNGIAAAKQWPAFIRELNNLMPNINYDVMGTSFHKDILFDELVFNDIDIRSNRGAGQDISVMLLYGNNFLIYNDDKNMKFPNDPLKFESRRLLNNDDIEALKEQYKIRKNEHVVMVGSLHEEEIENIAPALNRYIAKKKNSKLVIVPYTEELIGKLSEYFSFENDSCKIKGDKNCLVIEKQGILDKLYSMADIVLIGNTFHDFAYDGQNPLEPAFYGKRIISGTDYHKWNKIAYDGLKESGLLKKVNSSELDSELLRNVSQQELDNSRKSAEEFIRSKQGAARVYSLLVQQALYNALSESDKKYLSQKRTFDELKENYSSAA